MANQVYYSVSPFGTGDIKTGSPNISISSGVATLDVAQTGNIGQGCRITYDGHIAYISLVNSSTSFNVVTALGVAAADHASVAVTSIAHEYASLYVSNSGAKDVNHINNASLVTADVVLNLCCYYDHSDYTVDDASQSAYISGYTTDATRYINIYTPTGGTQSINNQRHSGKWDSQKYILSTSTESSVTEIWDAYVRVTGLQISLVKTSGVNSVRAIYIYDNTNRAADVRISNNIIKGNISYNPDYSYLLHCEYSTATGYARIWNNIAYYEATTGSCGGIMLRSDTEKHIYNNTLQGCTTIGIYRYDGSTSVLVRNNIIKGSTTATSGLTAANCGYNSTNLSSLGYTAQTGDRVSQTITFLDEANDDFHLHSTDTGAKGYGVTDPSSGLFSNDIDGVVRTGSWDIGADQYTAYNGNRTVTVKSTGGNYTTLNAALVGEVADLVTNQCILTIECYSMEDTTPIFAGTEWVNMTSASYYVHIKTPSSENHNGEWSTSVYRNVIEETSTLQCNFLIYDLSNLIVEGLQFQMTTHDFSYGTGSIVTDLLYSSATFGIDRCIFKHVATGYAGNLYFAVVIIAYDSLTGTSPYITNCVFLGDSTAEQSSGVVEVVSIGSSNFSIYNCTFKNCNVGVNQASITTRVKNCGFVSCVDATYGTITDATTNSTTTPTFKSGTASTLDVSDTTWKGQGTDLSGDTYHAFLTDITGGTRTGTWDIGAFEYMPSATLTGTITASIKESDIVAGGKTLVLTLTGDTWVTE
jgi:hypothetical protein